MDEQLLEELLARLAADCGAWQAALDEHQRSGLAARHALTAVLADLDDILRELRASLKRRQRKEPPRESR